LPSVVLTISEISSFLIMSTMCGRPSRTLLAERQAMPASLMALAVPEVAVGARLGDRLDDARPVLGLEPLQLAAQALGAFQRQGCPLHDAPL
jgi:hypothetical protein